MRVINQLRHEIFVAARKMQKLVYDKDGNWKKGLDRRDKFKYHRMHFQIMRVMLTDGEGRYIEPSEVEAFKKKFDMDISDKRGVKNAKDDN